MKVKLHPDMLKAKKYKKIQEKIRIWIKKNNSVYIIDENRCLHTGITLKCLMNLPFPEGRLEWIADIEKDYIKVYNKDSLNEMKELAKYLGLEIIYKYYVE